jgi:hypothetical protein
VVIGTPNSCDHFQRDLFSELAVDAQVSAYVDGLPDCGISFMDSFEKSVFSQHNIVVFGGAAVLNLTVKSFQMLLIVFPVCVVFYEPILSSAA